MGPGALGAENDEDSNVSASRFVRDAAVGPEIGSPNCGHEEYDPTIRFLRLFPPVAIVWLLLLFLAIAVIDAIWNRN